MRDVLRAIPLRLIPADGSVDIDPGPEHGPLVSELVTEIRSVFEVFDVPVWPSSEMVEPGDKYDVEKPWAFLE
jgi:hypothetical protein